MYSYCNNNPINCFDKNGNTPGVFTICLICIGAFALICGAAAWFYDGKLYDVNKKDSGKTTSPNLENPNFKKNENIKPDSSAKTNQSEKITIETRVLNSLTGFALGALVAGGTTAFVGASIVVFSGGPLTSSTLGSQVFATGALVFNSFAMLIAPIFGIELEPIEYDN